VGRQSNDKWRRRVADAAALAAAAAATPAAPKGIAGVVRFISDHWVIVLVLLGMSVFGFLTDIRSWITSPSAALSVSQEQKSSNGDFNPKVNIRVIDFSRTAGEGTIAIGVVNQGFKPIQNFYIEWWIDSSIGSISAGRNVLPQEIPFDNRRMMQFSAFITKLIPPGAHHSVWNMKFTNATRAGVFPMRLIFRDSTRTLSYPAEGLDLKGMSLTIGVGHPTS
jgi:hypothetical protein